MKTPISLIFLLVSFSVYAQEHSFKQLRYEENYEYLKNDTSGNWYQRMKYSTISKSKDTYFSTGGEIRYQYFYFKNQDWGAAPLDKDGFVLTRYLGNVDFHAGKYFRTFVQCKAAWRMG